MRSSGGDVARKGSEESSVHQFRPFSWSRLVDLGVGGAAAVHLGEAPQRVGESLWGELLQRAGMRMRMEWCHVRGKQAGGEGQKGVQAVSGECGCGAGNLLGLGGGLS